MSTFHDTPLYLCGCGEGNVALLMHMKKIDRTTPPACFGTVSKNNLYDNGGTLKYYTVFRYVDVVSLVETFARLVSLNVSTLLIELEGDFIWKELNYLSSFSISGWWFLSSSCFSFLITREIRTRVFLISKWFRRAIGITRSVQARNLGWLYMLLIFGETVAASPKTHYWSDLFESGIHEFTMRWWKSEI